MANTYDRILKEIVEPIFKPLTAVLMNVQVDKTEEIKDKIHVTLEREGDHLKIVLFKDPATKTIFHLEFHGKDEAIGLLMGLKKFMLQARLGLEVRQAVIYLGSKKELKYLKPYFKDKNTTHHFEVIMLNKISYRQFLQSNVPELVLLAILCDLEGEKPEAIIRAILERLYLLSPNDKVAGLHATRLEIFSRLRKLQALTIKIKDDMAFLYDLKTDIRFKQGIAEGKVEGKEEGLAEGIAIGKEEGKEEHATIAVTNMLKTNRFTIEEIAELQSVTVAFVLKTKEELDKQGKKK